MNINIKKCKNNYYKMLMSKKYFNIIFFFIFSFLVSNTIENSICTSDYSCNRCDYCGTSTNNFTSCFYYNMLCSQGFYTITYSPFMKNTLISLFQQDSYVTSFCGQKEYNIDNTTDEIIIFNSRDKNFAKDKYLHCYYLLNTENVIQFNPYLYIELSKNQNSKEPRDLKFELSNIYTKSDDTESTGSINHSRLRPSNSLKIFLENEKK